MDAEDGERLKTWRTYKGLSQRDLASVLGRSQGFVGNIEAGRGSISRDLLSRLSKRTSLNIAWLLTGEGFMDTVDKPPEIAAAGALPQPGQARIGGQDYSVVRVYEVDAAAGNGIVPVSEAVTDQLAFPRAWLMRHGLAADLAGLVRVRGDSMAPTIPDGAYVLVDFRGGADWSAPGIYIVRLEDRIVIKRLATGDNSVALISDNPAYPPVILAKPRAEEFRPIARVRAVVALL